MFYFIFLAINLHKIIHNHIVYIFKYVYRFFFKAKTEISFFIIKYSDLAKALQIELSWALVWVSYRSDMSNSRPLGHFCQVYSANRGFQDRWVSENLFTSIKVKPVCLVCRADLAVFTGYNIRRHSETRISTSTWTYSRSCRMQKVSSVKADYIHKSEIPKWSYHKC